MEVSSERIAALSLREQHILEHILHLAYGKDESLSDDSAAVLPPSLAINIAQVFQKEKAASEKTVSLDELMAAKPESVKSPRVSLFKRMFKK